MAGTGFLGKLYALTSFLFAVAPAVENTPHMIAARREASYRGIDLAARRHRMVDHGARGFALRAAVPQIAVARNVVSAGHDLVAVRNVNAVHAASRLSTQPLRMKCGEPSG